jgi:23S rRNA (guanosine2251-2'-O)-methyltransferase
MSKHSSDPSKKRRKAFSGNHQRSWLWGRHATVETLQAGKWPVLEIYLTQDAYDQLASLIEIRLAQGVPVEIVHSNRIAQLTGAADHQGLAVRLGAFPYLTMGQFEPDLRRAVAQSSATASESKLLPLVVMCDRIQDAFNFGSILRSCDGVGVTGVIVGEKFQSEVTPHVARSSSGAVNYVPIARTSDLAASARTLKQLGMQLVAADSNGTAKAWDAPLHSLTAIIIGSESHGVSSELMELCDQKITIPMRGRVTSLNAAVAAGVLLYEIRRQQM